MPEPTNDSPPLTPTAGAPLPYRTPGPEPGSQWLTDDQAYGTCLTYGLLLLTAVGAVLGLIVWGVFTVVSFL